MLSLFALVCSLAVGQWVGEQVRTGLPPGRVASWCWSFCVQYLLCLASLVVFDHAPVRDAIGPAVCLTWLVRALYFMKNLKSQ